MSRDYETVKCHHCDWVKHIPYPSLQAKVPKAPTKAELEAMSYALTQELIHHQNKTHRGRQ
jgi:hypothetical protein